MSIRPVYTYTVEILADFLHIECAYFCELCSQRQRQNPQSKIELSNDDFV